MSPHSAFPTILITGPSGVGKSTVASEVSWILSEERDLAHACIEMDAIGNMHPMPDDCRLRLANLRAVWDNYRAEGANRLILVDTLESASDLGVLQAALPQAQIAVFRLTADLAVLFERVSAREQGGVGEPLHREMAERHVRVQAGLGITERVIEADSRTPNQLAREILRLCGW